MNNAAALERKPALATWGLKIYVLDNMLLLKHKKMFNSHRAYRIIAMYHHKETVLSNYHTMIMIQRKGLMIHR